MHRIIRFIATTLFLCVVPGTVSAGDGPAPVLSVNGIELYANELNQEIQLIAPMEASFHGGMSAEKIREIERKATNALVDKELQYQDGLRKGVKLDPTTLEEEVRLVESRFASEAEFRKALKASGFTEKTLARYLERNAVAELMRKREVDDKAVVSDDAVKKQYNDNRQKYLKPAEYRASQILVRVDPSSNAEQKSKLKEKAMQLLDRLRAGADFAQVAEAESDDMTRIKGGDLGFFHAGTTEPEFDEAVKQMKVGEIRGPVETMYGFHLIKLTDKKDAHQLEFTEAQDKIRKQLVDAEKKRLSEQWMQQLKDSAKIIVIKKATP